LVQRVVEKVFTPLLENNVTNIENETESEEDEIENYDRTKGKWVDGGKLPPKT
jgi:hypothetical protein